MTHPLRRFLGLDENADDRSVLGLTVPVRRLTSAQVDEALADRITRLARHPDAESPAGRAVRARLLQAAERLRPPPVGRHPVAPSPPGASIERSGNGHSGDRTDPSGLPAEASSSVPVAPVPPAALHSAHTSSPSSGPADPRRPDRARAPLTPARTPVRLTQFDRTVLGLLVAGGGWNARSRSLLVSLASARGISPKALLQVVRGLGQHVREGGRRPAPDELSASISEIPWRGGPSRAPSRLERVVEQIEETVTDELRSDRFGSRFRVTVVFALLTLVSGAFLLRILLTPATVPPPPAPPEAIVESAGATGTEMPGDADDSPPVTAPGTAATIFGGGAPLRGDRRPPAAIAAVEQTVRLAEEIDVIRRQAMLASDRPSEIMRHRWIAAVAEAGTCWPLLDPSMREALVENFVEALRDAAAPSVADALLDALTPRAIGDEPLDLWRAAFSAGLLGEVLRRSPTMPPATVGRSAEHLQGWSGGVVHAADTNFAHAAGLVIDRHAGELVDATIALPTGAGTVDTGVANRWEAWFEAQRALRSGQRIQRTLIVVLESLLRSGRDLARPDTSGALLARLVEALQPDATTFRPALLRWYGDETIDSNAMWVLTGLLLAHRKPPEMLREFTVAWDAELADRLLLAERLAERWTESPVVAAPVTRQWMEISEAMRDRWNTVRDELEAHAMDVIRRGGDADRTSVLLAGSILNEAMACLVVGDESGAAELLGVAQSIDSAAESGRLRLHPLRRPGLPQGRPRGSDGAFAESMRVERDNESKLNVLRALRQEPIGDLGPLDAAELVRVALRPGHSAEVRSLARSILVEQFQHGRQVMLTLLDSLPDSVANDELSEVLMQITGAILPSARNARWPIEAREALLQHVILLRDDHHSRIDLHAINLAESYRQRFLLTGSVAGAVAVDERRPQAAVSALVDAWRERAESVLASRPLLELTDIDRRRALRRRLADGGVARLVGEQATLLELVATVIAGEVPSLREPIEGILAEATSARRTAATALDQAIHGEFGLTRLWRAGIGTSGATDRRESSGDASPDIDGVMPPTVGAPDGAEPRDVDPASAPSSPPTGGPRRPITDTPIEAPFKPAPGRRPRVRPRRTAEALTRRGGRVVRGTQLVCAVATVGVMTILAGARSPVSPAPQSAVADAHAWTLRLSQLSPDDPEAYFLLAEEIADAAGIAAERRLAGELFRLAGALSPDRFARSACLALADLSEDADGRRRFRAAATLLDRRGGNLLPTAEDAGDVDSAVALAFSEMLGQLRLGQGQLAVRQLSRPGVRELLERFESRFGLAAGRIETDLGAYRGGQRQPNYDASVTSLMLRIELGLIAGANRPFASDVLLDNRPLTEVDPDRIDDLFGIDPRRSVWRDGRWQAPESDWRAP